MNVVKKIARFVLHNLPAPKKEYTVNIVSIAPNEMLKGRTALITGGTSGIGLQIAKAFLRSGASVIITGRNQMRVDTVVSTLTKDNVFCGCVVGIEMDNADVNTFEDKLEKILNILASQEIKQIDILVNNAGILSANQNQTPKDDFNAVLNTNITGTFFLSKLVATYFKANKIEGNILNIASSSSIRPANSSYMISKWGIRGLTQGLAKSLAPYGITVNGLAPGPTATPMLKSEDDKNISLPRNPIGRYTLPEEIANMAVILVSPMGRTIVGDIIYMTGGAGTITFDDIPYTF